MAILRPYGGLAALLVSVVTILALPLLAQAHAERPAKFPDGSGSVPVHRNAGPHLVVCKADRTDFERRIAAFSPALQATNRQLFDECAGSGFGSLQEAVDHVRTAGMTILILPGLYLEEASLGPGPAACLHLTGPMTSRGLQILSYEQQRACPHVQNLVAIFGLQDLQVEGTGATPGDVVIDAQFQKLNTIRADRARGIYLRNFLAERSTFNAVYILETDGFVVDHVVGRWNDEYGFLSFAADHGLFTGCEAYGNGDSGVYPGGTSDINRDRGFDVGRYAIEVTGCHSHDNTLGYSGTGGDSVWVHNNEFDSNTGGASMDSLFPNHPGLPQNHALFEHNLIHGNNSNYYPYIRDGTCEKPYPVRGVEKGVVCPRVPVPVGSGVLLIGGNYDLFRENWVYDNWKVGFVQVGVPGFVHDDNRLSSLAGTSNFDRYLNNHLGTGPNGESLANGLDYFWDGQGQGNCWLGSGGAGSDPTLLPGCPAGSPNRILADPNRVLLFAVCSGYDRPTRTLPQGCDWWDSPARPGHFAPTVTVLAIFPALQLLAVVLLFGWLLRSGSGRFPLPAAGLAIGGALMLLAASTEQLNPLAAPGIGLLGFGWLLGARFAPGRRLAILGAVLGLVALLEGVDKSLLLLPIPLAPVWIRVLLEAGWMVAMLVVLVRRGLRPAPVRSPR